MTPDENDLDHKHTETRKRRAAVMIASGEQVKDVAASVGVYPRTVSRWLCEPKFRAFVTRANDAAIRACASKLCGVLSAAADTLNGLLSDDSPKIRLAAADKILTHAVAIRREVDYAERLATLEATHVQSECS